MGWSDRGGREVGIRGGPQEGEGGLLGIADLLAARDGQNSVLGVMPSKQGAVLTQALPSTAPLVKGTLTSALPLADKKLVPTDTKTPVETTLKSIGNFTKSSMEDLPVVPARVAVSLGATPLL